jgi:hypothetical protein
VKGLFFYTGLHDIVGGNGSMGNFQSTQLYNCHHHLREGVKHEGSFERHSDSLPEVAPVQLPIYKDVTLRVERLCLTRTLSGARIV